MVGAGPTGLALACGLRAAGVSVRVLDGAAGPAVTSRALGLQPRGVEVLDRLGALSDLPERAQPINRVVITVEGRELARAAGRVGHGAAGRADRPDHLAGRDRSRVARSAGRARRNDRMGPSRHRARRQARRCVRATRRRQRRRGRLGVGADGAHSVVRKALAVGFPGVPLVERFLLADVHATLDRPHDAASTWLRGTELLAAFPLPGDNLWRLMAPAPPEFGDEPQQDKIIEFLGARLRDEADGSIHTVEWTSSFRIQRRLADTYRRGRVLLAGDAAHIHSPLGGQGMNTGIGDAENLAWKLALVISGRAGDGLLDTYEAERRPIAKDVLESTSGLTELVVGESPARPVRARPHRGAPAEPGLDAAVDRNEGVAAAGLLPGWTARRRSPASAARAAAGRSCSEPRGDV